MKAGDHGAAVSRYRSPLMLSYVLEKGGIRS